MIKKNILKTALILSISFLFIQCNFIEKQKQQKQEEIAGKIIADKLKEHQDKMESGESSIAGQLKITIDALNKQCPVMVDEATRLDSCSYADKTIKYFYTITDQSKLDMKAFKSGANEILKESVKSNKEMAPIKMLKMNIQYFYADTSGKELVTTTITPDDYL